MKVDQTVMQFRLELADDGNLTTFGDDGCQGVFTNLDGLRYPKKSCIF
ncbi:hypothetical protein MICAC_4610018 [Microcystis aeruginosa PCC 9443]|jgi:hypothetical protein|uniref:Uncharacterized protein n=2 Tax=Microcystis TaxID=1125 RepID=I4G6B5_MICAE|nr:hypothetical protein MICAC_4610018 [Microcystis aeruginosa PCC 9443]